MRHHLALLSQSILGSNNKASSIKMPNPTKIRHRHRGKIDVERQQKLKNIREQIEVLSKTANQQELRSMEGWMKYLRNLDLIEENLVRLRDTMENRIYLDKIEETRRELESIGWPKFANRPLSMLEARAAMLRAEMNELNKVATKREKLILRQWSLENDMDLLEKNLAILKLHIDTRIESRGFFSKQFKKLLDVKLKFRPIKLFKLPKLRLSRKSDETWHYYSQISDLKRTSVRNKGKSADGMKSNLASVQACHSDYWSSAKETIYFAPWDQFFAIPSLTSADNDADDERFSADSSDDDDCWEDIDEIYAAKRSRRKVPEAEVSNEPYTLPCSSPEMKSGPNMNALRRKKRHQSKNKDKVNA